MQHHREKDQRYEFQPVFSVTRLEYLDLRSCFDEINKSLPKGSSYSVYEE